MNTDNWNYFYKIVDGRPNTTNLLYTPLVNSTQDIMCMWWNEASPYQENTRLTSDLVNFFFEREVKYLTTFQGKPWAPKLLEVDLQNRKIFIEWNKETLNTIIFTPERNLDKECPNWKEQIFEILKDILNLGYYKMALYPHCFFIDTNGNIKTFDMYSTIERDNPFIERKLIEGMIGEQSQGRFDDSTSSGVVNFEIFFKITLTDHLRKTWPDNPFPNFYKRLTHD
jgi:hypothetical protein